MTLELLDPRKSVRLVIDMQNAFCQPEGKLGISGVDVEPAQRTIPAVARLVGSCKEAGIPVIWSQQVRFVVDAGRARTSLPSHTQKRARVAPATS